MSFESPHHCRFLLGDRASLMASQSLTWLLRVAPGEEPWECQPAGQVALGNAMESVLGPENGQRGADATWDVLLSSWNEPPDHSPRDVCSLLHSSLQPLGQPPEAIS